MPPWAAVGGHTDRLVDNHQVGVLVDHRQFGHWLRLARSSPAGWRVRQLDFKQRVQRQPGGFGGHLAAQADPTRSRQFRRLGPAQARQAGHRDIDTLTG
jgi:hypothetical protein